MIEPYREIQIRDKVLADYLSELAYKIKTLEIRLDRLEKHNQKLP